MSRPPATLRKVGRVLVLLALFLACQRAAQTARALLGAGAVQFPRSVPPGIWARNLLVARRAEADGTLDGGEAEDEEDDKGPREDDNENKDEQLQENKEAPAKESELTFKNYDEQMVRELRELCRARGLPSNGTKAELKAALAKDDEERRPVEAKAASVKDAEPEAAVQAGVPVRQRRVWLQVDVEGNPYDVFLGADAIGADLRHLATPDVSDRQRANVKLFKSDGTELDLDGKVPLDAGSSSKSPVRIEGAPSSEFQALPAGSSAASWVEDALKTKFDAVMQNGNICMLQSWDTYKSTLPVREVDQAPLPLFELPYFSKEADVQTLGSLLARVPGTSRLKAPYLTAPGAYGKTSSVLPAFLTNDAFGLYLYMSFYNNAERRHEGPSVGMVEKMHSQRTDPDLAGVAFMWDCLKTQLKKGKYVRTSPRPEWFTSITDGTAVHIDKDKLRAQIKSLLDEIMPQRKLVLIHLDEHKKMWEGEDAHAIEFRRAAVQALLSIRFVRVILTFTEPPSLPPDDFRNTSALARVALPFARAAADKVALHFCPDILGMYGKPVNWTASEQRVWACCLLWVSLCIDAESPTALHQQDSQLREGFSSLTTWLRNGAKKPKSQFLAKFGETFEKVLSWDKGQNPLDTEMVRQLVAGIKDADAPQEEVMPTLVSVSGQRLRLPLFRLLYVQPLNRTELSSCFWKSRDVFLQDVRQAPAQVLVGSPLERAVLCALTCRDSLRLPNGRSIMLSFKQLEAGRLFEKVSATGSELQMARALDSLTPDTLYYDGLNGTERHPLADISFCAAPNWLVLLDCGGTKKKARKKMSAKSKQISQLVDSGCLSGWKVTMLIFAPAAPSATMPSSTALSDDVDIAIVAGSLATEWLGSWSQLWQYLPDDG